MEAGGSLHARNSSSQYSYCLATSECGTSSSLVKRAVLEVVKIALLALDCASNPKSKASDLPPERYISQVPEPHSVALTNLPEPVTSRSMRLLAELAASGVRCDGGIKAFNRAVWEGVGLSMCGNAFESASTMLEGSPSCYTSESQLSCVTYCPVKLFKHIYSERRSGSRGRDGARLMLKLESECRLDANGALHLLPIRRQIERKSSLQALLRLNPTLNALQLCRARRASRAVSSTASTPAHPTAGSVSVYRLLPFYRKLIKYRVRADVPENILVEYAQQGWIDEP